MGKQKPRIKRLKKLESRQQEFDSLSAGKQAARTRPGSMSGRK